MKETYILQPEFIYQGEKIQALKIIPDFTIYHKGVRIAICDPKGMITVDFRVKIKLLKHKLLRELKRDIPIFMPTNTAQMNETLSAILCLMK